MLESPIEDTDIVARVRAGEGELYAELVRRHHPRIIGLCQAMLGERAEAEDAAQESFLKAYRSLGRFTGASSFSTWLYRIASNQCLDLLRRRAARRTESWDALVEAEGEGIRRLLNAPADEGRRREDEDLVRRVLACLSAEYRLVLTLRETQGLSYEEIAEAMECSVDSVKARLRRARQEFEERLRHFSDPQNV